MGKYRFIGGQEHGEFLEVPDSYENGIGFVPLDYVAVPERLAKETAFRNGQAICKETVQSWNYRRVTIVGRRGFREFVYVHPDIKDNETLHGYADAKLGKKHVGS